MQIPHLNVTIDKLLGFLILVSFKKIIPGSALSGRQALSCFYCFSVLKFLSSSFP